MSDLITSVLGMDLKADIRDINGDLISTGIKKTIYPVQRIDKSGLLSY